MKPAAEPGNQQHRAAEHERRGGDGNNEPLEVAADAAFQGFNSRDLQSAQIAVCDAPEDASRVAGRIIRKILGK